MNVDTLDIVMHKPNCDSKCLCFSKKLQ